MPTYTDRLLSADEQKFVRFYVKYRDIEEAAQHARLKKGTGKRMFQRPAVREDIDRRIGMIEKEETIQDVRSMHLAAEVLDVELKNVCQLDPKLHGSLKMEGLRLAYIVTGRLKDRNLEAVGLPALGAGQQEGMPAFYQQMFQHQVTTHTITANHEAPPKTPEPMVIDVTPAASQLPPRPEAPPTIKVY